MLTSIEGIDVNGEHIANTIMEIYPDGNINLDAIYKYKLYNYLVLFGIRISICDTSMPDDIIGGIRLRKSFIPSVSGTQDYWEILYSNGSTDPSPYWLTNPMSDAAAYGGTAWIKEGQYLYTRGGDFKGYPCFRPLKPITVYRWKPTQEQINDAKAKKIALSDEFAIAQEQGLVKIGTANDTLIHRTWGSKLYKDSAGCQVFGDNASLKTLTKWAGEHYKLYKKDVFSYTLLNKPQFINTNALTYSTLKNYGNKF